jgi:hypothetical protein
MLTHNEQQHKRTKNPTDFYSNYLNKFVTPDVASAYFPRGLRAEIGSMVTMLPLPSLLLEQWCLPRL